ncbi:DUF3164 family protein [Pseudogemmobacter sonorensis]|uniref:DUF3164 family protein n=1 Tax=Pseudogemmobacter sonorensis TaxID=2989681 RepID=UPI0036A2D8E9
MPSIVVGGPDATHMLNHRGHAVPIDRVSDVDKLITDTVLSIRAHAEELADRVARFKGHTYDDVGACLALIAEKHGVKRGGPKGNISLVSFDGCTRVDVRTSPNVIYGPELDFARDTLGEYLALYPDLPTEIAAMITLAFGVDQQGTVNRERLYSLRRLENDHPLWVKAMDLIVKSERRIGSKSYIQISRRDTPDGPWQMIPINLARA